MDDSTTLDPNGASADILEHAIFELQATGHPVTAWVATHDMQTLALCPK